MVVNIVNIVVIVVGSSLILLGAPKSDDFVQCQSKSRRIIDCSDDDEPGASSIIASKTEISPCSVFKLLPSGDFGATNLKEVISALYDFDEGNDDPICLKYGIPVTRQILRRLRLPLSPKEELTEFYLNDELINFFMGMLSDFDLNKCANDPTRLKSHFFLSGFMSKLRDGFEAIKR